MSLYQSAWKPRGVRKDWEKTSIGRDDARAAICRRIALKDDVQVTDAVAWWRRDASLAVMVADLSSGTRMIMRQGGDGTSISFEPQP